MAKSATQDWSAESNVSVTGSSSGINYNKYNIPYSFSLPANAVITKLWYWFIPRTNPESAYAYWYDVHETTYRGTISTYTETYYYVTEHYSTSQTSGTASIYLGVQQNASVVFERLMFGCDYTIGTTKCGKATSVTVSATESEGNVTLSWSGATAGTGNAITSYGVQYRDSSNNSNWGNWTDLASVASTSTSGSTSVAPNGTRGYYRQWRVQTRGKAGSSYYSDWSSNSPSVKKNTLPAAPGTPTVTPTIYESGNITISWSAATDASGYEVEYSTSSNNSSWGGWTSLGKVTGTSKTHAPTLDRGSYIRYRVRSYDSFGVYSSSYSGNSASVRRNTAPTTPGNVTASPAIYENGNITVSWTASTDATGSIDHYKVQYSTSSNNGSSWGSWADVGTATGTSKTHAPSMTRGHLIRYRVCAVDNNSIESGYGTSGNVRKNRVPGVPTISHPQNNQKTLNARPVFLMSCPAEPDGQTQKLQMRYTTNGDWVDVQNVSASGGNISFRPPNDLDVGSNSLSFRLADSQGVSGTAVDLTCTLENVAWSRQIDSGTVICTADAVISHIADIQEMLTSVNERRDWCGLSSIALPGTVGLYADWLAQMTAMYNALVECYGVISETAPSLPTHSTNYPAADIINTIRGMCQEI